MGELVTGSNSQKESRMTTAHEHIEAALHAQIAELKALIKKYEAVIASQAGELAAARDTSEMRGAEIRELRERNTQLEEWQKMRME